MPLKAVTYTSTKRRWGRGRHHTVHQFGVCSERTDSNAVWIRFRTKLQCYTCICGCWKWELSNSLWLDRERLTPKGKSRGNALKRSGLCTRITLPSSGPPSSLCSLFLSFLPCPPHPWVFWAFTHMRSLPVCIRNTSEASKIEPEFNWFWMQSVEEW